MINTFGNKLSMSHALGQKAIRVAKRVGKVASGAGAVGAAVLAVRTVGRDQNVRQVGRLLQPGLAGLVHNAMK
tara:strand:- start:776 stop:994 length:219 start_codon:yes stop_codon:yes gene_type:complete